MTKKTEKKAVSPPEAEKMETFEIEGLITFLEEKMHTFMQEEEVDFNLSGKERQRLFSAGVRNNGFIDVRREVA